MKPLRIELVDVKTPEQIELVRNMFHTPDVERNLDHKDPLARPGKFAGKFAQGLYQGHLWRLKETGETVGVFLLHCSRLKSRGLVELDVAVPDALHRGKGYSKDALVAVFDHWLLHDRCQAVWGWIRVDNEPSIRMVKALDIPIVRTSVWRSTVREGQVESVEAAVTKDDWLRIRPRLPYLWPEGVAQPG